MIYLDYAANTPADKKVLECFLNTELDFSANPNSSHPLGKAAHEKLDEITSSYVYKLMAVQSLATLHLQQ